MASRRRQQRELADRLNSLGSRLGQSMRDLESGVELPGYDPLEVVNRVQASEEQRLQQAVSRVSPLSQIEGDFEPYYVDQADEYYQGPDLSTRVAAHQFIPNNYEPEEFEYNLSPQFAVFLIFGKVYVRWQKPRRGSSGLWVYGTTSPISLDVYRQFKSSGSKGKYVRHLEAYGHSEAYFEPDELAI